MTKKVKMGLSNQQEKKQENSQQNSPELNTIIKLREATINAVEGIADQFMRNVEKMVPKEPASIEIVNSISAKLFECKTGIENNLSSISFPKTFHVDFRSSAVIPSESMIVIHSINDSFTSGEKEPQGNSQAKAETVPGKGTE